MHLKQSLHEYEQTTNELTLKYNALTREKESLKENNFENQNQINLLNSKVQKLDKELRDKSR